MNQVPLVIMPPSFAREPEKPRDTGDRRFALILVAAFALVGAVLAWHHELGHDEVQGWLIGRDCLTSSDVVTHSCRHGQAAFWQLGIHAVTWVASDLMFLQFLHLALAALAIYLFARWAPFGRLMKVLFAFGYFPLFEFGVVCQGQALSMLLLFAICTLFPRRHERLGLFGFLLFLLGQSSTAGFVLSIAIAAGCVIDWLRHRTLVEKRHLIQGSAWLAASAVLVGYQQTQTAWHANEHSPVTLFTRAFLPIPDLTVHFWDSSLLNVSGATALTLGLHLAVTAMLLSWCTLILIRRPAALTMFFGTALALTVLLLAGAAVQRPSGILFLTFVAVAWMAPSLSESSPVSAQGWIERWRGLTWSPVFANLLVVQAIAGGVAAYIDSVYAFSCGQETAKFIREHQLENAVIVSADPAAAVPVSGYLGRKLYDPLAEEFGSFTVRSKTARAEPSVADLSQKAQRLSRQFRRNVVLLLGDPLDEVVEKSEGLRRMGAFTNAVIARERYYLYLFPMPDDVHDPTRTMERLVMNWSR